MAGKKGNKLPSTNPFEASGSGAPLVEEDFWFPKRWSDALQEKLTQLGEDRDKCRALFIVGEYGSGKSYCLRWLERVAFPKRKIVSYYFENPEVRFYDLANALLRRIGRKHFAKLLFEISSPHLTTPQQKSLFSHGFEEYLTRTSRKPSQDELNEFQEAIIAAGICKDEEVAMCLARVVVETRQKPYFEYRDFISAKPGGYVAEKQEVNFFNALLKTMRVAEGVDRIAFLVDEFEQVSLQRKLTRKDALDYHVTLKRLIDTATEGGLWLVLGMTPDAASKTKQLDPALSERCYEFVVPELTAEEASELVENRFKARGEPFPFEKGFINSLPPSTYSNPRRLVKVFFVATNNAIATGSVQTTKDLSAVDEQLYPQGGI